MVIWNRRSSTSDRKPIDYNPTNWIVGYRADLIFGQDAAVIHSSGFNLGTDGDLEQAFVDIRSETHRLQPDQLDRRLPCGSDLRSGRGGDPFLRLQPGDGW